jgi:hypothetical protein
VNLVGLSPILAAFTVVRQQMRSPFANLANSRALGIVGAGACLALASVPRAALAADTQLVWEGYATVTASTIQCSGHGGTGTGDTHVSIFRPKILSTDTPTFLSFILLRFAETMENTNESTVPQMHGLGNYAASAVDSRAKFDKWAGTYSLTVSPPAITASTPVVLINGNIDSFENVPGCTVTFKGVYVQRID